MIETKLPPTTGIVMEEITDPVELEATLSRGRKADRNAAWFKEHAAELYRLHRGKFLCVAGQELFAADAPEVALKAARATHPDDVPFVFYVRVGKNPRIYADLG
jgi:hypothetical protein